MKRNFSISKSVLLTLLFFLASFPQAQENLHIVLTHHHDQGVIHSHQQDGSIHYHTHYHSDSSDRSALEFGISQSADSAHQHFFREFDLVFLSSSKETSRKLFYYQPVLSFFEAVSDTLQAQKLSYNTHPISHLMSACEIIVLSHPNKAPPLA